MAVDATKVLVGTPDQTTTGAIMSAPLATAAPTTAVDVLDPGFGDSGFVSEDGLELAPDITTAKFKDWSGATVREVLEQFDGTIKWAHLETNEASLENYFGEDHVEVTAADGTHGNQVAAKMGAYDLPRKSWVFKMKDGDTRILIYVPIGQITKREAIQFRKGQPIAWGVTLTAYPDGTNNAIYFFTDDGQIVV
ncbi:hypothetical protein LGT39_02870 [Demequina sp. TTPB684]|uniref:phage tail tube protein n=1 Tax=unclassified Demequina TaxID=2620311 RepID=UPI001CF5BD8F|nr:MULTISPECIES: hypothetical protein [unclassified Demequina]MCB2411791.1 hypothetical protein [Demequina sp. TTPB684]UPU89020.1 hypothetical protein LGT36_003600 [Demequina sp. TMPB413]